MIRAVQSTDAEVICAIYNYYISDTVITFEEKTITATDILARIDSVHGSDLPWYVIEDNSDQIGKVVGYAYATRWRERFSYRFSVEVTVYLAPEYGGKGLGTQLYNKLFETLKQQGIHSVIGGITLPNAGSIALHEKFNMEKVAHFKDVGLKFNRWLDVGYWQVTL